MTGALIFTALLVLFIHHMNEEGEARKYLPVAVRLKLKQQDEQSVGRYLLALPIFVLLALALAYV